MAMKVDLSLRQPEAKDGSAIQQLLKEAGGLDVNSAYSYMLLGHYFKDTCLLAESGGTPVGYVSAFRIPGDERTLFVWQVAVHPTRRGEGLARRMLAELLRNPACADVSLIEATVSPSNKASHALFQSFARGIKAELQIQDGYPAAWFPDGHEEERLYRIGPITTFA